MTVPQHVKAGRFTRCILEGAVLEGKDDFPASQEGANEIEAILAFLEKEGEFERLLPRLRAKERDSALAEARAAFCFHEMGFTIVGWEPEAVPGVPGDLEVSWRGSDSLFIEVKCPNFGGEVELIERAERFQRPKYICGETRSVVPVEHVTYAVTKALPKFSCTRCNLVVVVDDLFTSPLDWPRDVITRRLQTTLTSDECFSKVSEVFMLNPVVRVGSGVEYRTLFVPGPGKPLPPDVSNALRRDGWSPTLTDLGV